MIRRPPRSTRTDTLFPYTTLFRSVSESVLNRIDQPMVGDRLKFRAAQKQLSGFIEGWKPYLDLVGRLHPVFKLHGTVTGRLSCEHPNLQQVPRDPRIRTLITAPDGWEIGRASCRARVCQYV